MASIEAFLNTLKLTFFLALFLSGCREYIPQADQQRNEAIKRAKDFYGKLEPQLLEKFAGKYVFEPQWSKSSYTELDSSVYTPIAFDSKTGNNLVLVSAVRETGVLRSQVIERWPAAAYYKKVGRHGDNVEYDGYINFYNPQGEFVIGAFIQGGVHKYNYTSPSDKSSRQ